MTSSFSSINNLFSYITINGVFTSGSEKLTGGIYMLNRPINSEKEDLVIKSLPLNTEDIQEGVLMVNIHIPNLELHLNGVVDKTQPDLERIEILMSKAIALLKNIDSEDGYYNYELLSDQIIQDDNNQHYINLRVLFRNIN